ncbi:MAG TPA: hypothetical protein VMW11_01095 [Candidatus Dormibacteraeota bacterium]|nr:hypothetical protein [Candidatus Dormibacteraeota bacterium]
MAAEPPPNFARRLLVLVLAVGIVSALAATFVVGFLLHRPPTMNAAANTTTAGVRIHLEVVGSVGSASNGRPGDPNPTWPGYLPTTTLQVPSNSVVTVQIDEEDAARGLRNPFWSLAQGIVGGTFHMTYYDNNGNPVQGDFRALDSADATAHTFAIPDLGVFVPLEGLNAAAPPGSMNVITFSFRTGKPGVYHWQCFVPCGSGTIDGNGGPMQTLGYMVGLITVQ